MSKRTLIVAAAILGLIVIIAAGWYLGSPLFIDETVDEAFPFEAPDEAAIAAMPEAEREELEKEFLTAMPNTEAIENLSSEDREAVEDEVMNAAAVVMRDKPVADDMRADEWTIVGQGQFVGVDDFHQGSGRATIFQQGEQRVVRFEDFSVTNGPDLHVILTKHPSPTKYSEVGDDYIDLGPLKGNMGNQNYKIPADVDLSAYQGVVIYCVPFHAVFATAALGS
ncbi:MAG: DM13 domain-containing protein [Chloroflexota bacterium]